ncbi:peptidase S8/S53 domain-containing protein [Colletotrichum phormii]|uniref:tripeptidyl-peptidase II n=1 Tax=Colletotrichum phormii TaxID=359342 RepID=A0AAJ0EBL9_9PEZI|nr:peptidase S8/S53 domain-containing protein [Colletotrichum phormii]KAK1623838.1 peptidase S8/S53 domain-containing protein [Colletotrichum phormii]
MLLLLVASTIISLIGPFAIASRAGSIQVEYNRHPPSGWKLSRPTDPNHRFSISIAADRSGHVERALYSVSTPGHELYGTHLSREEAQALLSPDTESRDIIINWLQEHGNATAADIASDSHWIRVQTTTFGWFRNVDSGNEVLRTLKYSLPLELKSKISLITPSTRFCSHLMMHQGPAVAAPLADDAPNDELRKVKRTLAGLNPKLLYTAQVDRITPPTLQAQVDPTCNRTITPNCIRALYNVPFKMNVSPARGLGIYASQNQVAKFDDFALFAKNVDQPSTGFSNAELNFDVQYTASLSNPVPNIVTALPDDKLPHTITTSFGENEQSLPDGYVQQICDQFGALGARGVTMFAASGDSGPGNTCVTNDGTNSTRFNAVFPASCPFVTGVGGFTRPAYQEQAVPAYLKNTIETQFNGLFNASGRGFPDVSAQSFNLTFVTGGQLGGFQGTSAAAPIWAGMVGMVNAALIQAGKPPMGFINPWLYGAGLQAINDVSAGQSVGCTGATGFGTQKFPPEFGAKLVPNASWPSMAGWDAVTGLGSPDIGKILALRMAM